MAKKNITFKELCEILDKQPAPDRLLPRLALTRKQWEELEDQIKNYSIERKCVK